jgi:hypothetical protein
MASRIFDTDEPAAGLNSHDRIRFACACDDAAPILDPSLMERWSDAQLRTMHALFVAVRDESLSEERPAILRAARYHRSAEAVAEVAALRVSLRAAERSQLALV